MLPVRFGRGGKGDHLAHDLHAGDEGQDQRRALGRMRGAKGAKVPTKELPDWVVGIGATFSHALKTLNPLIRHSHRFSSEKARRVIGLKTRPAV